MPLMQTRAIVGRCTQCLTIHDASRLCDVVCMNIFSALTRRHRPVTSSRPSLPYLCEADDVLIRLNRFGDSLRTRDFYEGIQIMGGTGSGKSSGSGRAIALAMLRAGWGGLVLCAKPDEAARWRGYAEEANRGSHVIHMRPHGTLTFNFVDYEVHRPGGEGQETYNLVALLEVMMEASAQAIGHVSSGEGAAFWIAARRELLANAIEPLVAALGAFRLVDLMRMVTSAPTSREEAFDDRWKEQSFCYWVLSQSYSAPTGRPLSASATQASADYWFSTFARLDEKTRSNIVVTLTAAISPFLRGVLNDSFCTDTTVIPELTHEGAIIIMDYSVKTLGAAAFVAGQIMKYQWQKATERRWVGPETRPCFLFADECQFFLSKYDAEFQSTARSSRAATVYLTQNLPTYFAQLPGRDPRAAAESLLGNFQTKIFHANTETTTNRYASDLIGKTLQERGTANWSTNAGSQESTSTGKSWGFQYGENEGSNWGRNSSWGSSTGTGNSSSSTSSSGVTSGRQQGKSRSWTSGGSSTNGLTSSHGASEGGGWSEQMDDAVPPVAFASALRKGGQSDQGLVDAVIVQGGRRFEATGAHWLHCTFRQ